MTNLQGKVCLVTGATAGIGKAAAAALAKQGADVVITGRNRQKAIDTVNHIKTETGNETVKYLLANFENLQQVSDLAATYKQNYEQLDVLINNAGAYYNFRRTSKYGVEMTLLVNHLAPFLLTMLLLDVIKESTPARIINVSSRAHIYGKLDFENLGFSRGYIGMYAYARSKLANIFFTYELARRLENEGITVNAVHPGHVATDIWRITPPVFGMILNWISKRVGLSPEEGADTIVYIATSPEVEGITGKYFVRRKAIASSALSYDKVVAQRLWNISEELTGIKSFLT
jgi:NAD(P)-dependent dehydrogenase (short-subunit alcohol dehydrogenase family)